jgi:hypothetical protein
LRLFASPLTRSSTLRRYSACLARSRSWAIWLGSPKRRVNTARGLISLGSGSVGLFQAMDDE